MSSLNIELQEFADKLWDHIDKRLDEIESKLLGKPGLDPNNPKRGDWCSYNHADGPIYFRFQHKSVGDSWVGTTLTGHTADYRSHHCVVFALRGEYQKGDYWHCGTGTITNDSDPLFDDPNFKVIPKEVMEALLRVAE